MQYVGRIARDATKGVLKDVQSLYKNSFMQGFGPWFSYTAKLPHAIPTALRVWKESTIDIPEEINVDIGTGGQALGHLLGAASWAGQGFAYYKAVESGHPYLLAIPVATNAASLIFENVRKAKQKIKAEKERQKA